MAQSETQKVGQCPCTMFHQVPMAWLVTDRDFNVLDGNDLFWEEIALTQRASPGTSLEAALPEDLLGSIRGALDQARKTDEPVDVPGLRVFSGAQPRRVVDLLVAPVSTRDQEVLLVASSAVGDAGRRVEELTLLHDMVRVLRQETQIERVLFTTLTCATAGSGGLGFNRAWVLLCDSDDRWLEGQMALGPGSPEEAHQIWTELTESPRTLDEFAAAFDRWTGENAHPLQTTVEKMRFSMKDDADRLPVLATIEGRPVHVQDAATDERVAPKLAELIGANEFVVVPMVVRDEPCGVIMADNIYSNAPITQGHIRLLSLFAQHAGMAIEDAQNHRKMESDQQALEQAYADLQKAQDELVRTHELAVLGEMAARVAHDLRNPLVTLGGWARVVEEDPTDTPTVVTAARIIAEESSTLEKMLNMLLEPLTTRTVRLEPTDLNRLVDDTLQTQEHRAEELGIAIERHFTPDLPPITADPAQFRRCLVNLMENAIEAMSHGGMVTVTTRMEDSEILVEISDTGMGITEDEKARIFDAFFTTGSYGSGLGLAIVWDIVQSHGYSIDVRSEPGHGSTFAIRIPLVETSEPESSTDEG